MKGVTNKGGWLKNSSTLGTRCMSLHMVDVTSVSFTLLKIHFNKLFGCNFCFDCKLDANVFEFVKLDIYIVVIFPKINAKALLL